MSASRPLIVAEDPADSADDHCDVPADSPKSGTRVTPRVGKSLETVVSALRGPPVGETAL